MWCARWEITNVAVDFTIREVQQANDSIDSFCETIDPVSLGKILNADSPLSGLFDYRTSMYDGNANLRFAVIKPGRYGLEWVVGTWRSLSTNTE